MKPSKRSSSGLKAIGPPAVSKAGALDHKLIDSAPVRNAPIRLDRLTKEEVERRRCKAYKYFI